MRAWKCARSLTPDEFRNRPAIRRPCQPRGKDQGRAAAAGLAGGTGHAGQAQAPPGRQRATALVDTPAGQRLAIQVTLLLTADEAKGLAAAVGSIAASMSTTGLIIANGAMTP
jgi:hypothetical protein